MELLKQVELINDAIVRGDLDGLLAHYADDVRFVTRSGVVDGRQAFRDHFAAVLSSVRDLRVTTTWAIESDDTVATESRLEATSTASGGRFVLPMVAMLRFRDRLVTEEHEYYDTNELDRQLASTSSLSTGDPVEVVRKLAEAWNAHDLDAVYGAMTEDYREFVNGVLVKTSAAEARAADQAATYDVIPDYRRTIEELWGSGDRVLSRFTVHGTTGDGRRLQLAVACTYVVRDGRIAESRLFFDPSTTWQPD